MEANKSAVTGYSALACWMARLSSLVVSAAFLLIMFLALTNEDRPQGPAILLLALLALTIAACFVAWRWQWVGAIAVILGALVLGIVAYASSLSLGLGYASILGSLIYGLPFLLVGVLFWLCGRTATTGPAA